MPESYIAIALAYVGPIWQPVRNMGTKSTTGLNAGQTINTGMAGAEFVTTGYMRRKASMDHESLDLADVPVLEQIVYQAACGTNVLFLPDPVADAPMLNMRIPYMAASSAGTSVTRTGRHSGSRRLLQLWSDYDGSGSAGRPDAGPGTHLARSALACTGPMAGQEALDYGVDFFCLSCQGRGYHQDAHCLHHHGSRLNL